MFPFSPSTRNPLSTAQSANTGIVIRGRYLLTATSMLFRARDAAGSSFAARLKDSIAARFLP